MHTWKYQRYDKSDYSRVPNAPGVYKYLNTAKDIIYVGKAKDLRKRVSSYFVPSAKHSVKTARLVHETRQIEFVIVPSEYEALVLENELIKENQPKYNINLKDGKSYPSICITRERFPRVFPTRRIIPDQGEYFGPFTSVRAMNGILDLIKKWYKLRTCNFNLSEKNVNNGKFKVCLEYHLENCKGPCEGLQDERSYNEDIEQIRHILKGHLGPVKNHIKQQMSEAVESLQFERAQFLKNRLTSLDKFQTRSLVANPKISQLDVFSITSEKQTSYVNFMKIEEGGIRLSETIEVQRKMDESEAEILSLVMFNLRKRFGSTNTQIVANIQVETWDDVTLTVPKIGDKRKLIELSLKNVKFYKKQSLEKTPPRENKVLEQLKEALRLQELPQHIECFDNSNIQGSDPVAAMVCFKNGKPAKKDYRKFHVKTVEGPNDFASMTEIVARRYGRLLSENQALPQLIVIDGGKGQLSAAVEALQQLDLYGKVPIIGIAKRLEEIYVPEDPYPIHISKKSPSLRLIQHLRDEAHRFAISFHRDSRSKGQISSILDHAPGIGDKSKEKLLTTFKSMQRIKQAGITDLAAAVGLKKAQDLYAYLHEDKKRDQQS